MRHGDVRPQILEVKAFLLIAAGLAGCSVDCTTLAQRYALAFADAQRCVPGQDTCTYPADAVDTRTLPDGGVEISIGGCINTCGGGNVNPKRAGPVAAALADYRGQGCGGPLAGCFCPLAPDGGPPEPFTCRASADGGGVCSP
jgi:hypothetical protein